MNSLDSSAADDQAFSIEELESRFEMEAMAGVAGITPATDWSCSCSFTF
jgi:hypothetical protein